MVLGIIFILPVPVCRECRQVTLCHKHMQTYYGHR